MNMHTKIPLTYEVIDLSFGTIGIVLMNGLLEFVMSESEIKSN